MNWQCDDCGRWFETKLDRDYHSSDHTKPAPNSARVRELEEELLTVRSNKERVQRMYVELEQERDALHAELRRCEERKRGWKDLVASLRAELDRAKRVVGAARNLSSNRMPMAERNGVLAEAIRAYDQAQGICPKCSSPIRYNEVSEWCSCPDDQAAPETGGKDGG